MSGLYSNHSDAELVELLCEHSDEPAFEEIYRRYGRELVTEAHRKTGDRSVSEDIVQEVFIKLWLRRNKLAIDKNIQAYLKGMLRHHVIDYYTHKQSSPVVPAASVAILPHPAEEDYMSGSLLQVSYQQALAKLPEKCREVFELSRNGHSIRDISQKLGISEKTVEVHIGKALRILRLEMKDYIVPALIFFTIR